jgi:hypothetical protein
MEPREDRDIALVAQLFTAGFQPRWTLASRTRRNSSALDNYEDESPPLSDGTASLLISLLIHVFRTTIFLPRRAPVFT